MTRQGGELSRAGFLARYYDLLETLIRRQLMLGQAAIVDCWWTRRMRVEYPLLTRERLTVDAMDPLEENLASVREYIRRS
jgi:hypothetical protein